MTDPRMDSAWESFKVLSDRLSPHELAQHLRNLFPEGDLVDRLVERHNTEATKIITLREPLGIGREKLPPWYAGPQRDDRNWPAFRAKLLTSLPEEAVERIHGASEKVVAMLDHPATRRFDSRGLVVGHVQSGKTSNFTAVACKAADRGYRLFIVLSGVHNSLRRQTQTRLVRDMVETNPTLWHQITGPDRDFQPRDNPQSFFASEGQHLLLVVKKNGAVLQKLRRWLSGARELLENCPTLVIDDEADQATVATKKINPLIRGVLDQLPRVCYIGYTATPFGNLLIDPADERDFYPRHFVLSLPQSPGYQGPEALFGREALDGEDPADVPTGLDMIREIPEGELSDLRPAKRADVPQFEPVVSGSLSRAIRWFWLATAARRVRDRERRHSSMLLHAHSDTAVHDSYGDPLRLFCTETATRLALGDESVFAEFEDLWFEETARVDAGDFHRDPTPFDAVLAQLPAVVGETKIIMDHYRSTDRLDYDAGPVTVIAVGGNTLSRGLTLEGLVVSVFVRSANMYDTLLQMGRWFGYRPGYEDLPRIWMPALMRQWFTHLASVEAEMRREIERYLIEHTSPLDMAVRIKCHPKMRVTAPSRMGSAVRAAASYGGDLVETRYFRCAPQDEAIAFHEGNRRAVEELLTLAADQGHTDRSVPVGRQLYRGVPSATVLSFVRDYRFDPRSVEFSPELVTDYVRRRMVRGGLRTWNVGVLGSAGDDVELPDGTTVGTVNRARRKTSERDEVADIKTLTGSRDPGLDLDLPAGEEVNRHNLRTWRNRQHPEVGLLLLYPIDGRSAPRRGDRVALGAPVDVVWGAAFIFPMPISGSDVQVEYDYVQADLSKVFPAAAEEGGDEDASVLDEDQDAVAEVVGR